MQILTSVSDARLSEINELATNELRHKLACNYESFSGGTSLEVLLVGAVLFLKVKCDV